MSYSLSVKGASKHEAKNAVAAKMREIAEQQPVHVVDEGQAKVHAWNLIDLLPDPAEDQEIVVTMSGYISAEWKNGVAEKITGVNAMAYASLQLKKSAT